MWLFHRIGKNLTETILEEAQILKLLVKNIMSIVLNMSHELEETWTEN